MLSIDPYRRDRMVWLNRVGDMAGKHKAALRRATQHRGSASRITGPTMPALGKGMISKPFQPHKVARAFNFLEFSDELIQCRLGIE